MKVRVRLLVAVGEPTGNATELEVEAGTTAAGLKSQLPDYFPRLKEHVSSLLIFVNGEYVENDLALKDGDELFLVSPLYGG